MGHLGNPGRQHSAHKRRKAKSMRNFIIFFRGKEGTSPVVRLLDHFEKISIIHAVNNSGWEPFDRRWCGLMPLRNLERCLDLVFSRVSIDFDRLNRVYLRTAKAPLAEFDQTGAVGFKMRFHAPKNHFPIMRKFPHLERWSKTSQDRAFRRMMFDVLKRNDVVVFVVVRQDVLRWALSTYHGDGTGRPGHLQFKLASGKIDRDEIGTIHVDCARLEQILSHCAKAHAKKRRLMEDLKLAGIRCHVLRYEDFLADKTQYFRRILDCLDLTVSIEELEEVLKQDAVFTKVHSDVISDFVENHEEIEERFGHHFTSWS